MKTFFLKNKVFLLGLLGSITITLQQFLSTSQLNYAVIGVAVLNAGLAYIANQWRGQGVSILGFLGTAAYTYTTINNTGHFSWAQFILSSIIAFGLAVAPPPKPATYEQSATIVAAKTEPPVAEVKDNTILPVGIKS